MLYIMYTKEYQIFSFILECNFIARVVCNLSIAGKVCYQSRFRNSSADFLVIIMISSSGSYVQYLTRMVSSSLTFQV